MERADRRDGTRERTDGWRKNERSARASASLGAYARYDIRRTTLRSGDHSYGLSQTVHCHRGALHLRCQI